jgi:hypothetical protein
MARSIRGLNQNSRIREPSTNNERSELSIACIATRGKYPRLTVHHLLHLARHEIEH